MRSTIAKLAGRSAASAAVAMASAPPTRRALDWFRDERMRRWLAGLPDDQWLDWAYRTVFERAPDPVGAAHWAEQLRDGTSREAVLAALRSSPEALADPAARRAPQVFHEGRQAWMRSLPRARRIVDLGGTSLGSELGAMIVMGYPYEFESLTIVELPSEERHDLYDVGDNAPEIPSPLGPVRYRYHSMVDLSGFEDASVDLVVSGQTFEHIEEADGRTMLAHIRRILAPGGHLALDTPNWAVTAIMCKAQGVELSNPDHKIEYTHPQLSGMLEEAGLEIVRAQGIGYMPRTVATGEWHVEELVDHPGLYDAIEDCYTLAYLARPA